MSVRTQKELAGMRRVGRVVGLALQEMKESARPGMTTGELDYGDARPARGAHSRLILTNAAKQWPAIQRPARPLPGTSLL